jgi:uncharacterized membrane protein
LEKSFEAFVSGQRQRHGKRLSVAVLVMLLIAVLLSETQWLNLRTGLIVLLAGQAGVVTALLWRRWRLDIDRRKAPCSAWFVSEERFIQRLTLFETACQVTGFLLLGRALWMATGSLLLALAIGVVYPMTLYVGLTRRKTAASLREIRQIRKVMLP